jgi:hypothetical protein
MPYEMGGCPWEKFGTNEFKVNVRDTDFVEMRWL